MDAYGGVDVQIYRIWHQNEMWPVSRPDRL